MDSRRSWKFLAEAAGAAVEGGNSFSADEGFEKALQHLSALV